MVTWRHGTEWDPSIELPEDFFSLYETIYRKELPNAIRESKNLIRFQFSKQHDYFRDGRVWLAMRPNEVRLCGFVKPGLTMGGKLVGYFGFWETENLPSVNQELFAELELWMKSQGVEQIIGPVNFSTFSFYRISERADLTSDVFLGEPHTPFYYPEILKNIGFQSLVTYATTFVEAHPELIAYQRKIHNEAAARLEGQFDLLPLNGSLWLNNLSEMYQLTLDIFQENPAFVPITYHDFQHHMGDLVADRMCPNTSFLVRNKQGRAIAYVLCYPNYGSLMRIGDAGSKSFESINYENHFSLIQEKILIGKTIGVIPEYRGRGLQHVLSSHAIINGLEKHGYQSFAIALVRKNNFSEQIAPPFPSHEHRYVLYGKAL